jgi:hypothetical protein
MGDEHRLREWNHDHTDKDTSGGIHVAGGGTLYAKGLTVTTSGQSAAAFRYDRGGGTMVVDGGTVTHANGVGYPAVYFTADISITQCGLTPNGTRRCAWRARNTVRLYDSTLKETWRN